MGFKQRLITLLEDNRGLVVLLFCLPASYIFNLILLTRNWLYRKIYGSSINHHKNVAKIQKKIHLWKQQKTKKLLCTSRPNWLSLSTKFFQKDKCHQISVDLVNILELDQTNLTIRVEPMVTVGEITDYLIPMGYTLAVTLEIADATLGGLAMGTGMTTYSHKVGLYHENVVSYEVVLGDGSFVVASNEQNSDLYKALPWSHGSLGFLVALTIKIIKIKPYVKLTYVPIEGQKNYCDMIRKLSGGIDKKDPVPDYLEATVYSRKRAVIMIGEFSNGDQSLPINHVTKWYKPWFYKHTESALTRGKFSELIPLDEYLLRHNRAIFWVVESMIPFGNNPIFRLLFGWLLPPKPAFLKFTTTPGIRTFTFTHQVFQDIVLPINELECQIDISEKLFDTYPLLIYPCRIYDHGAHSGQLKRPDRKYIIPGTNYAMYNDLGVYGVPGHVKHKRKYNPIQAMRDMEKFTRDVGGFSFLYADIFMTKPEFEEMFDLKLYETVRERYFAEGAFPHLYDKVKPEIDVFKIEKHYET